MPAIVNGILAANYDGFVSIEFEGIEDALLGASRGLENAQRIFAEVAAARA